jgi:hypothetical protein
LRIANTDIRRVLAISSELPIANPHIVHCSCDLRPPSQ